MITAAARLLRGTQRYTATMCVAGFAQSAHLLVVLGFISMAGPLPRFMAVLLTYFGIWIGTATAYELTGLRTALMPVI